MHAAKIYKDFVTLMMEALSPSETSVLTRATRRNIPETPFFIVTAVKTSNLTWRVVIGSTVRVVPSRVGLIAIFYALTSLVDVFIFSFYTAGITTVVYRYQQAV
jgi:hypothetical protein